MWIEVFSLLLVNMEEDIEELVSAMAIRPILQELSDKILGLEIINCLAYGTAIDFLNIDIVVIMRN